MWLRRRSCTAMAGSLTENTPRATFPNLETIVSRSQQSTFSPVVSLVSPSLLQESAAALVTAVSSGTKCFALYARWSPFGFWEKTSGVCSPLMEVEPSEPSSMTWPRWGIAWDGACTELAMSVPRIVVSESSLWPTVHGMSQDGLSNGPSVNELGRKVNRSLIPTPKRPSGGGQTERTTPGGGIRKTEDWVSAAEGFNTGSLNPQWVEWLMGFEAGWTDLGHSETP